MSNEAVSVMPVLILDIDSEIQHHMDCPADCEGFRHERNAIAKWYGWLIKGKYYLGIGCTRFGSLLEISFTFLLTR